MMTRPKFIAFAAMSLWCAAVWARPASLQVIAPDTTLELASTKQHGNYFVALNDLRRKMNLAVLEDQEAKLIILASVFDCVPVYAADEQDAITVDKTPFIRWELAAKALGVSQPVRQNNVHVDHPLADLLKARIGTEVGDHAAGFGLESDRDSALSLRSLAQDRGTLLLFVRSGAWDPQSKWLLRGAQTRYDSLRGAGVGVAAIHGYESKEAAKWAKDLRLRFPLLFDPFSAVMRVYGVFDKGHLPFNAIFLLDKNGVIRLRQIYSNPDEMPDMNAVMREIATLP